MHDRRLRTVLDVAEPQSGPEPNVLTFADFGRFLRLRRWAIMVPILTALAAAYGYIQIAIPVYTARAQIIIDPRMPQFIPGHNEESLLAWDSAQVESEIAVLQSERIADAVVTKLGLDRANDFRYVPTLLGRVLAIFMPTKAAPVSKQDRFRNALILIQTGLTVRRTGLSYAIDITFAFPDPLRATEIANSVAETYIADQLENRSQAARVGGEWLQRRMVLLKAQMNTAAQAVQLFRASHNYSIPRPSPGDANPSGDQGAQTATSGAAPSEDKTLDELEASASTYRRIYESFLQSFTESVQRQSFPVSDARILTPASLPQIKSAPRNILVFALSLLLGGLMGFGLALVEHHLDDKVRSAGQVAKASGLDELGTLPRFQYGTSAMLQAWAKRLLWPRTGRRALSGSLIRRQIASERRFWRSGVGPYFAEVGEGPDSPFRSAILTMKVLIELEGRQRPVKSLGVTAPRHGSGTSTLVSHLATLFADCDTRTLLIDADVRGRELTKRVRRSGGAGLVQVLAQSATIEEAVVSFKGTKLDFLPATGDDEPVGNCVLASEAVGRLLKDATAKYDLVILDLPPVLPIGEVVAISSLVDGVILVVEEGTTSAHAVATSAGYLDRARARALGFVLTKATV